MVATDGPARARLWQIREGLPEAMQREGVPHSIDAALPLARLAAFAGMVPATIERASPGARLILFGHLLDGNLHVNVIGPGIDDTTADDAVLDLALELGGTVSAEHGIGVAKAGWLSRDRAAGDIEAMRAIKRALDPDGILNPGRAARLSASAR